MVGTVSRRAGWQQTVANPVVPPRPTSPPPPPPAEVEPSPLHRVVAHAYAAGVADAALVGDLDGWRPTGLLGPMAVAQAARERPRFGVPGARRGFADGGD